MTERFTVDYDITTGNYDIHDKNKSNGVDGYIAYLPHEEQANLICDLLNEQDKHEEKLFNYFFKWFEEERGTNYEDFCVLWVNIKSGDVDG